MTQLQATSKAEALSQLKDFVWSKHNISLDELDQIVDVKAFIDEWWKFEIGIVSAFVSFGAEQSLIDALEAHQTL